MECRQWTRGFCRAAAAPILALVALAVAAPAAAQSTTGDRACPSRAYYGGIAQMYDGDYRDALKTFLSEGRSGIKTAQSRWIDSICYHTLTAETYYRLGDLNQALEHYTSALKLYVAFHNWMVQVKFPPSIRTAGAGFGKRVPWGTSTRQAPLGQFSDSTLIQQGRVDNNEQVRRGGVVQQAVLFPLNVQEVVRATTLAIRRRAMLLGPLRSSDALQAEVVSVLSQRPGQPNHWSECWIDLQLGAALAAAGKESQALANLQKAVVAGGQFDHPLTGEALLELGLLSLQQGNFQAGGKYLEEATYAAANYSDWGVLEEALRYGAIAHFMANHKGIFPPLKTAIDWAKRERLRELQVSLLILAAENFVILGNAKDGVAYLEEARHVIGRRTMGDGQIGARLNFVTAAAAFQQRRVGDGETALAAAMKFMRGGSVWLFQISLSDALYTNGGITPRVAMDLYRTVLRDPQTADWTTDPMESLAVLLAPHPAAYEHWFEAAIDRKDYDLALEIGDRLRRHRFFASLRFGGRLEALRWLLESPEATLEKPEQLHRQDILARYPGYEQLRQQAQQITARLSGKPLIPNTPEATKNLTLDFQQLAAIAGKQEAMLREMAVRREAAEMVFPPVRAAQVIQKALPAGHAVLAFVNTSRSQYAFLLNNQRSACWAVPAGPLYKKVTDFLRDIGQYDANREYPVKELNDEQWKASAAGVLELLTKGSPADFSQPLDELIVVPDGVLWYLPFEALQVSTGGRQSQPLISRFRLRYVPLASLAVPDARPRKPSGRTAVVVGQLFREGDAAAKAAFEQLAKVLPGTMALPNVLPAPSPVYLSLFDRLVVLDQVAGADQSPLGWSPVSTDKNKPGTTLEDWLALPFAGPQELIFPGFHTATENALKKVTPALAGHEVFVAVCGLMTSGARTVLLSRWRTGGQTSFDLVREFAQELPHTTPADAWQRSAFLALDSRVALEAEPRVKRAALDDPPKATHPFFWAGYMLVDSTGGLRPGETPADDAVVVVKKNAAGGAAGANAPAPAPGPGAAPPDAVFKDARVGAAVPGQAPPAAKDPAFKDAMPDLTAPAAPPQPPATTEKPDDDNTKVKAKPSAKSPTSKIKPKPAQRGVSRPGQT